MTEQLSIDPPEGKATQREISPIEASAYSLVMLFFQETVERGENITFPGTNIVVHPTEEQRAAGRLKESN